MNKVRRKEIERAIAKIEQAREILEEVMEQEQEAFDNMPESLQNSERGNAMEEYIYTLSEMIDTLDCDSLQEIVDG